jgi:hypothetical protein
VCGERILNPGKGLGFLEPWGVVPWGVQYRSEALLERGSSVGAYEEPRMNGVPRTLNRGVPIFHEGIAISNNGDLPMSPSSTVLGLRSSPGCVITILNPPGSDSRATLVSGSVESDMARRCRWRILICFSPESSRPKPDDEDGGYNGLHWRLENCAVTSPSRRCEPKGSRPAVLGGVMGNTKFGWG